MNELNFVSLKSIKEGNLDAALEKFGYVRSKVMAERWGLTQNQLNKKFAAGYTCDEFKINGIRYMSTSAVKPE